MAGRPERLAADRAYSIPRIRRWLRRRRIEAVIPQKRDELNWSQPIHHDKRCYRRRNVIERAVGWLKECRHVATRFEKLAVNFLAVLKLAIIRKYLRMGFSDRA